MGGVADTADRAVKVLCTIPGFATCGLAAIMGAPVVPILIFTAVTALGIAAQLKSARDQAERDRIMRDFVREVRQPFNSARHIALKRWPDTPQFDDLNHDWMKVLEAVTVEEADRVIRELRQIHQQYWNWFAEYIIPRLNALQAAIGAINVPPLYWPEPIPDNDYYYANEGQALVGRQSEQAYIQAFLESPEPVAWMLMVGGAGSGKSRLGLWAAKQADAAGYIAGFLNRGTKFDEWDQWIIHGETFIVIDYVLRRSGNLKVALDGLIDKRRGHKIRVLVIERNPIGDWWSNLQAVSNRYSPLHERGSGTGPTGGPHIDLGSMSHEGSVEVFDLLFNELGLPVDWPAERLAIALEQADPKRRPLFARFLAEAVKSGDYQPSWTARDLASRVLKHELNERWIPQNVDSLHANLATAACALKGVDVGWLDTVSCLEGIAPRRNSRDQSQCQTIAALGGGFNEGFLPSHEPDTLAELYILDRLSGRPKLVGDESVARDTRKILDCLWGSPVSDVSPPLEDIHKALIDLIQRAANNFLDHEGLKTLREVPPGISESKRALALGHVFAAELVAAKTDIDRQLIWSCIDDTSKTLPGFRSVVARLLAQALFAACYNKETTPEGKEALQRLKDLATENHGEHAVILALASALTNLLSEITGDSELDRVLEELINLHTHFSLYPGLSLVLAQAYMNAIGKFESDSKRNSRLAELRLLAKNSLINSEWILALAKAFANAIYVFGDDDMRMQSLDDIVPLSYHQSSTRDVALTIAGALAYCSVNVDDYTQRNNCLAHFRTLVKNYPDVPAVRIELAKALRDLVSGLNNEVERRQRLDELRDLAWAYFEESTLKLTHAKARAAYQSRILGSNTKVPAVQEKRALHISAVPQDLNIGDLSNSIRKSIYQAKIMPWGTDL